MQFQLYGFHWICGRKRSHEIQDIRYFADVICFFQDFITQKGNGGLAMGWGSMIAFGLPPEKMLALVTRLILFQ